ncbi:UrcA family protein [Sphingomonas azotifigens]|uniref:UrcA family protein n=1 Tax=Sphingomonas azotifigens TaxID=330920 RepID=UPI00142F81FA|nr:UrcA family protein [Sphingomonas azotifigens]
MKTFIVMAAMLGTIATVPAQAQDQDHRQTTVHVAYKTSDLLDAKGRAALQRRVALASNRVCTMPQTGSRLASRDELNCRRAALADARQQAERAILAANQGRMLASDH